ncbi:MAG: BadF/BadG/BcrA/BcrD ATPase family protein [Sneathiella sp.]
MAEPYILAADCGGTHCRVRLYDVNGTALSDGISGPANINLGAFQTVQQLEIAANSAISRAKLPIALSNVVVSAGIAGFVSTENKEALYREKHPFKKIIAASDAYTALLGAFGMDHDGAIVITGTGSCVYGRENHRIFTLGGWGPILSDQASGARAGMLAVRKTLQAQDGIISGTTLTLDISGRFGPASEDIYIWSKSATPADFGTLAPVIFETAASGDEISLEVVRKLATEAEQLIHAVKNRACENIILMGGLADPLRPYLSQEIQQLLMPGKGDAIDGALLMAQNIDRSFVEVIGQNL